MRPRRPVAATTANASARRTSRTPPHRLSRAVPAPAIAAGWSSEPQPPDLCRRAHGRWRCRWAISASCATAPALPPAGSLTAIFDSVLHRPLRLHNGSLCSCGRCPGASARDLRKLVRLSPQSGISLVPPVRPCRPRGSSGSAGARASVALGGDPCPGAGRPLLLRDELLPVGQGILPPVRPRAWLRMDRRTAMRTGLRPVCRAAGRARLQPRRAACDRLPGLVRKSVSG